MKIKEVKIIDRVRDKIVNVKIDFTGRTNLRWCAQWDYDGYCYKLNQWDRDDGRIDKYVDVLVEAENNGLNPHLKGE